MEGLDLQSTADVADAMGSESERALGCESVDPSHSDCQGHEGEDLWTEHSADADGRNARTSKVDKSWLKADILGGLLRSVSNSCLSRRAEHAYVEQTTVWIAVVICFSTT
jgi:hypothetical protein